MSSSRLYLNIIRKNRYDGDNAFDNEQYYDALINYKAVQASLDEYYKDYSCLLDSDDKSEMFQHVTHANSKIAWCYFWLGDIDKAKYHINHCIDEEFDNNYMNYYLRGLINLKQHNYDDAICDFDSCDLYCDIDGFTCDDYIADAYKYQGKFIDAIDFYISALHKRPEEYQTIYTYDSLIECLEKLGDLHQAKEYFKKASTLFSNNPDYDYNTFKSKYQYLTSSDISRTSVTEYSIALKLEDEGHHSKAVEHLYSAICMDRNLDTSINMYDKFAEFIDGGGLYETSIAYKVIAILSTRKDKKHIYKIAESYKKLNKRIGLTDSQKESLLNEVRADLEKYCSTTENNTNIYSHQPNENNTNCQDNIEELLEELNSLIGLSSVKEEVNSLINLLRVNKIRALRGMKQAPTSMHLVFSGNPGTGKTTVARILAKIYKELGVISGGQLVEVDRSKLVAGYVGQTAIQTQEKIQEAIGGVLFIDEAYTLSSSSANDDFGQEAIDVILKAMEDNRDNLVVIVAGYPELMQSFLDSNPGLRSRFNKFIDFEDYSSDEMTAIFESMCEKSGYSIDESTKNYLLNYMETKYNHRDENFANAREVRNLFERAVTKQANRLSLNAHITDSDLISLAIADIA